MVLKLILALAAGLLVLAGCAQQAPPSTGATTGASPAKAGPAKPTGTLTIAEPNLYEENFLPQTGNGARMEYLSPLYDFLFYLNHDTWELQPGLVTKWELSSDNKTLTFNVREGVKFSNGDDLTAEDIKYTFELLMSKESTASRAAIWRTNIKSIDIVNPYLMKLNFNAPTWGFMEDLASGRQGNIVGIVSKKYVERVGIKEADLKPIASGPYKLVEQKRGEYVKYEAVEDHWRVTPEFKYLVIKSVPDEATRAMMLQSGEADLAPISAASVDILTKAGFTIQQIPTAYSSFAAFGGPWTPTHKFYKPDLPWAKKEVREALSISINRDELVQHIYKGAAKPAPVFTMSPGWNDLKPYAFDPARAKTLLAQAGYPNGFELTVKKWTASPGVELPLLAEAVASFWDKIGVKVKLVQSDLAATLPDIRTGATSGILWFHVLTRYSDYGDPNTLFHSTVPESGRFQMWQDDNLTKLLGELAKIDDAKGRQEKMKEITRYNYDNFSAVPLTVVNNLVALSPKITGWKPLAGAYLNNFEYITHSPALGTPRLYTP